MDSSGSSTMISIWEHLRDPVLSFSQETDCRVVERTLTVLMNSCQVKKSWFVPMSKGIEDPETQALREEQFTAFCTWLLGRLLCILGRKSLLDIHVSCVKAQICILEVCAKNRFMLRFFFLEYLSCVKDLLALQTSETLLSNGPHLLKRFTPLPSKALQELDLVPKYILIKSQDVINTLESYFVEILESMIPNIVDLHEDLLEKCWFVLCDVLQLGTPSLKLTVLKAFLKIMSLSSFSNRIALAELCNTLKFITQAIPSHLLVKDQASVVQNLLTGIIDLVEVCVSNGSYGKDISRLKDLLTILHSVISLWNLEWDSDAGLSKGCSCVVLLLDSLPCEFINLANFQFLMNKLRTQEFAVKILEKCIFYGILDHLKSKIKYKSKLEFERDSHKNENFSSLSTCLDVVQTIPIWATHYHQMWMDIHSLQSSFPAQPSEQTMQGISDIVGKVQSVIRCAVGVHIFYYLCAESKMIKVSFHFFQEKVGELISFLHFILMQLASLKASSIAVRFCEAIFTAVVLSIRNLFLLPEVHSCSSIDLELATSIIAIPWIAPDERVNFKMENHVAQMPKLFPEFQSVEMKIASLHALACIPCNKAAAYKFSVFSKIIGKIEDPLSIRLASEVIKTLPVLLMDSTQRQSDLLHTLLPPALEAESEVILTSVSEIFSPVVCILAGNISAISTLDSNGYPKRSHVCLTCNKNFQGTHVEARNLLPDMKDVISNFMALLASPVVAVRRNIAASLSCLVLHLSSMYKPDIVNTLIKYAEDEDYQVRLTFSSMVKFLIFSRDWMEGKEVESEHLREEHIPLTQVDRIELSHSRPRLDMVLKMLVNTLNSKLSQKDNIDVTMQDTLLSTIVDIGCVPLDCVLLPVLKIVLVSVSHPNFKQPSLGQVYLKRIADAHNTRVKNLYHRFQSDICQSLICAMGMNFHARPMWTKVMDKVVNGLGFESAAVWLRQSLRCVLPFIMVFVVKFNDSPFFNKVLELLRCSAAPLVKECFQYIYPYIILNESDQILQECVKKMEEMSGIDANDLILSSFKTIHNELLLHYHSKMTIVEGGICRLISVMENTGNECAKLHNRSTSKTVIAKHLETRFLGVLVHFDSLLESSTAEESSKLNALQSLPQIILLMGSKYITPVRFKVLSTLRTALRLTHCDFPHLSCGAWEAFIQSVDIKELGPLLGTITASLLPLLDQFPEKISEMLQWMVVDHESELSEHISDLFFLPNEPTLQNVYLIVQKHVAKRRHDLNESQNLADYLHQPLRFIAHDNVDIRRHGLEYLLSLLKEKQAKFTKSLLQGEVVHDDVAKLLCLLVEGCRDTDEDIRLLCVQNLGLLGALDPGHLPHKKPALGIPQILSVNDDQFAIQALTVLAKAYQAARNTRNLDSFSLAIQDLIKYYNISSSPIQLRKNLWDSFPESIQQIMAPLENSSYIMTDLQKDHIWPHPLFGTRYASSLTMWAHTWACRIVTFIEEKKAKDVFLACIPSLKTDINCVLYFLPFILLYAVIPGRDDQHKMMVEEMTFIIQQRSLREEQEEMDQTTVSKEKYQVPLNKSVSLPQPVDSDSTTHALCSKTVITLLDFLHKWVGWSRKQAEGSKNDSGCVENVLRFLNQFSKLDLAHGNYDVNEYARALMYLEDFLMEDKDLLKDQDHLSFLGRIYAQMDEPDGIKGVLAVQCSQPKLLDAVVYHEVADQYQEALACYELLAKEHGNDALTPSIQKGMVRCCLSLDQPYAALHIAEGAISKSPEYRSSFLEAQAECFWRIYNFENLEVALKDPKLEDSTSWGVSIGRCLIDIRKGDQTSFKQHLCATRSFLGKALSTASLENGSYLQGYPQAVKLHMLQELEEACKVIVILQAPAVAEPVCLDAIQGLVKMWEYRLALVQSASAIQEPLLRLRRCLLQMASAYVRDDQYSLSSLLSKELGTCWLKSAEVARVAECFQQAYIYLLNAEKYKPKRHFIELAKLHWQKNEQDHALTTLRRGLDEHFPNSKDFPKMDTGILEDDRKICAEAKLLVARYNDQNMNVDLSANVSNYTEAVDVYRCWEKSNACLAQYYDRMSLNSEDPFSTKDYQLWAVITYTKSLRFGCSLIYQSMSRILTLWLDYGKKYHSYQSTLKSPTPAQAKVMSERKTILDKMNLYIDRHIDVLPSYMIMIGFSQLVSRICHPVAEVFKVIKKIIVKLLLCFPQQTMWMMLAIHWSSHPQRRSRCQVVLEDPQIKHNSNLLRFIEDFVKLGSLLTDLCHKPVPKEITKTNVNAIVKSLPKLLAHSSFSKIIVPIQRIRTLTLPQQDHNALSNHEPFPMVTPFIAGIKDEVTILGSLQRPRKVTLRGSDGLSYEMMCKDKDDLRLDARVMEFNSIVNKYLQKDPASRSRSLNIRTYSVVPLNEESGLIEWVPNLSAFRLIVSQLYKEMGCFTSNREIRKYMLDKDAKLSEHRDVFLKRLVPLHPPVFRNWFRNNFTDSRTWFEARKSYVHTLAVMSMVGYILGLGDRHGENILLDTTCGDVVHVDFNCLFNKGMRFECPERVPFRLTHNMVSAMGPTGVEGPFRHACEITLHMLREMRETLLSVLQPFVYDPNVNDSIPRRPPLFKKADQEEMKELTNDSAVENVKHIDLRLNGMMQVGQEKSTLQLSVEGQTAVLIQEATSIDNLCRMYIGWGGYI